MQHKNGDLTEALESFTGVLKAIGNDRLVYESRGLVYQEMKNHEYAIQDFDAAIELEPGYPEIYYYKGLSRIEEKRLSDAIDNFNKALELGSNNPGIFSGIGQSYRLLKNFAKALLYLNKALEKSPGNEEFLVQRSNIYVDIGKY